MMSHTVAVSTASGSPVGPPAYPARRSDWLHQFTSLLSRADVARQIGRDAVLLLIAIAIEEDRQQYRSAPLYFDSELMRRTGIRSVTRLDRVIRIAEDAGWLMAVYPDDDETVGQYWTLIPNRLKVFETVPELPGKSLSPAISAEPQQQNPAAAATRPDDITQHVTYAEGPSKNVQEKTYQQALVGPSEKSTSTPNAITASQTESPQPISQQVSYAEGPSQLPRDNPTLPTAPPGRQSTRIGLVSGQPDLPDFKTEPPNGLLFRTESRIGTNVS